MPELPEVEVTRRGVENHFLGRTLLACTVRQPRLRWPVPDEVHHCSGHVLETVARRSKYLCMVFGPGVLVVHLGMSGSLKIVKPSEPWAKHDHIEWNFGDLALRYNDPRRFGSVEFQAHQANWEASFQRFAKLGPEPFSEAFTPQAFHQALAGKAVSIKALLLAGTAVVGVGNIYASEALFHSGIRPGKAAGRLTRAQASRLHSAILMVLQAAIDRGGSSLRDFKAIDGELGHFQLECAVYGREGQPCRRCGGVIKRRVMGQRSTFYCPGCQK